MSSVAASLDQGYNDLVSKSTKIFSIFLSLSLFLGACAQIQDYLGLTPSEGSLVPQGEYKGSWKLVQGKKTLELAKDGDGAGAADASDKEVKITLFPMKPDENRSTGILFINDRSNRFYWKASGNRLDTWNILFAKDNNEYTELTSDFSFDGLLKRNSTGIELTGSLKTMEEDESRRYFVTTLRSFPPELIAGEAPPVGTVGQEVTIEANYLGDDKDLLVIRLTNKADFTETKLKVARIEAGLPGSMVFKLSEDLAKGEYTISVLRGEDFPSNTLDFTIN